MSSHVPPVRSLLLDTNVVLHLTRDRSPVAANIDRQFGLSSSTFRPAICEVTVGELLAFAQSERWGDRRAKALRAELDRCLILPISTPGVRESWAVSKSTVKANGVTLGDNDLWIAATAQVNELMVITADLDFARLGTLGLVKAILLDARTGLRL